MHVTLVLASLLSCYAVVDLLLRGGALLKMPAWLAWLSALALVGAALFWSWQLTAGAGTVRWLAAV